MPPTQITAADILQAFHFERVGPDPKRGNKIAWVYQDHLPNLRIYLPAEPSVPAVLYSIWDSGADKLVERLDEHESVIRNLRNRHNHTTFESAPSEPLTPG